MTNLDIYELPAVSGAEPTAYCGGACTDGCVEVTALSDDAFALTDNKLTRVGRTSPEIRMTGEELDVFAAEWVRERGLTV
ncbi:DUF397 domain-containing protein [Kitasatospora cineracea]|uniref:DUF397 domain-containing protein n=1 Tax=Kitasatospora cineracea TaxID=88074 RepID=A0A3N4RVL9_9ACTN|nr:DUF397 domain-containing protein [Kitasatospora cineracea]RPE35049.1 hypothetical protein EDD38_3396 [Kitasatospora cineracea]